MDEHNFARPRTLDDASFIDDTLDEGETASQTTSTEADLSQTGDFSEWDTADDEYAGDGDGYEPPSKRKCVRDSVCLILSGVVGCDLE